MANTSKNDLPFEGPYKKTSAEKTDKSGAKHGGMSRARHLARMAADAVKKKTVKVNPEMKEGYFKNQDIEDQEREQNPGMRSPRKPAPKKELKGDQHKLDKNKNGKIDAHDFKLLRKEEADLCSVCGKEPCECPGGDHINEISRAAILKYKSVAKARAKNNEYYAKYGDPDDDTREVHSKQYDKRTKGLAAADKRLNKEEVEHIEEDMKSAAKELHDYASKHGGMDKADFHKAAKHMDAGNHKALHSLIKNLDSDPRDKILTTLHKHGNDIKRFGYSTEEVELGELSNTALSKYKEAAGKDASAANASGDIKKGNKRFSGIIKATIKQFANDAKGRK